MLLVVAGCFLGCRQEPILRSATDGASGGNIFGERSSGGSGKAESHRRYTRVGFSTPNRFGSSGKPFIAIVLRGAQRQSEPGATNIGNAPKHAQPHDFRLGPECPRAAPRRSPATEKRAISPRSREDFPLNRSSRLLSLACVVLHPAGQILPARLRNFA